MCIMNSYLVMERIRMLTDLHTYGQYHDIQNRCGLYPCIGS